VTVRSTFTAFFISCRQI